MDKFSDFGYIYNIKLCITQNEFRKENPMPISAKQLDFCDVSKYFGKFYNQNQNNLLTLLGEHININDLFHFLFIKNIIESNVQTLFIFIITDIKSNFNQIQIGLAYIKKGYGSLP